MSIPVSLVDLETTLVDYPWGYFVSINDEPRAHLRAVPTRLVDGVLLTQVGDGTKRNVTDRPKVTMVFPPVTAGGMSLIVDGDASVVGDDVVLTPTSAVLHRPALREG